MTTFEVAKLIRRVIMVRAAESMIYTNWSAEFTASEMREIPELVKSMSWYVPIQPLDLTKDQMMDLGFRRWSEDNPIYLIPQWLFPFLPEEIECGSIDSLACIQKKSEMDTDQRGGCLAYGVIPKE